VGPVCAVQETHHTGCTRGRSGATSGAPLARISTGFLAQFSPNQVPTSRRLKQALIGTGMGDLSQTLNFSHVFSHRHSSFYENN